MTEDLKPCPFCGQQAQIDKFIKYSPAGQQFKCVMINCTTPDGCCAGSIEVPYGASKKQSYKMALKEVIEAWNKRSHESIPEQLKKFIDHQESFQPEVAKILREQFWDLLA